MKQSNLLIPTLRETPANSESISHQLLMRAGFIRQTANGLYIYLPLAHRVVEKIKDIIREEFQKIDAVELKTPLLIEKTLVEESSRYEQDREDIFKLSDSQQKDYILAGNYEEAYTELVRDEVNSYKRLPLNLFQIQINYQDIKKPRHGLLRSRESIKLNGYSFHATAESLEEQYRQYEQAFHEILKRCKLECSSVLGRNKWQSNESKEFIALSEIGDKTICVSTESDYAASLEMATSLYTSKKSHASYLELEKVATPKMSSIQEIATFLDTEPRKIIRSLLYFADEQPILVLMRGDHQLNRSKLENYLQAATLREGTSDEAQELFDASFGWLGPVGISESVTIYADNHIQDLVNVIAGANQNGFHWLHVNPNRDFKPKAYEDFRLVQEGDLSPDGSGELEFKQGINIGQIGKANSFFSEKLNLLISDDQDQPMPVLMGCYQIDISRLMAAIVEQHFDESGIVWPREIAPFDLHLLQMDMQDDSQTELTGEIREMMMASGYQVLVDDRLERQGVKFAEADLIGCPIRITVGKKATDGIVEIKIKQTNAMLEVRKEELASTLEILLHEE